LSSISVPIFRSSGRPGYSRALTDDPRHRTARKYEREVRVHFATEPHTIATSEGTVYASVGDAIVTGPAGESWRVSRAHFPDKYRPVPPLPMGSDGAYVSLRTRIVAVQMSTPFEVILYDDRSRLKGEPRDWLVDYGDGSFGIVANEIFPATYELER
jgi:PGDYG protein